MPKSALLNPGETERENQAKAVELMLEKLFSPDLSAMQASLQLATRRQALLTSNLANVNTPGYKRQDIDFNISLDQAIGSSSPSRLGDSIQQRNQTLSNQTSMTGDGNNVDLEQEVRGIAETQLRYSALSQMASGYFADLKNVIKGA